MTDSPTKREQADRLHEEGISLSDAGDKSAALEKYLAALELDPHRPATLYNAGLIYKYRAAWTESFRFNQRAYELRPSDEATAWNLAIAATALRDWATARAVWKSQGFELPPGEGPIDADFGITPVRLNPNGEAEVVWAERIDLVRAHLTSIPFTDSGFRFGDLVLHDGAPVGYREHDDREYPVFNVLELFQASRHSTYEADVVAPAESDIEALDALCRRTGVVMEDWSRSARFLCKACSEGRPHEHHDHDKQDEGWRSERRVALAAISDSDVEAVLDAWRTESRKLIGWDLTLAGSQ